MFFVRARSSRCDHLPEMGRSTRERASGKSRLCLLASPHCVQAVTSDPLPAILGPRALRAGVPTAPSYCCVEHFRVVHVPLVCRLLPWRSRGDYCSFACLTADTSRAVTPQLTSRHAYVMIVSRTASPPCHTITPISPVAGEISRRLLGRHAAASMASIVSRLDCAVLYAVTPPLTINYLARCTARPVCHTWSSRC